MISEHTNIPEDTNSSKGNAIFNNTMIDPTNVSSDIVKSSVDDTNSANIESDGVANELITHPNLLTLNHLLSDKNTTWQIHNCKMIDKRVTQDEKLAFIYHYDALPDDVKNQHPLNASLLKQFQTPMYSKDAAELLNLDPELFKTPWQVKVTGTLVMFCEPQQIALRLKFTNTAKALDPIYTKAKEDALATSMDNWHFYGDVFILNKRRDPLIMTLGEQWIHIPRLDDYQVFPTAYTIEALALLEEVKTTLPQLNEAIKLRLLENS